MDRFLRFKDHARKILCLLLRHIQYKKGEPLGGFPSDAGQSGEMLHQLLQRYRNVCHCLVQTGNIESAGDLVHSAFGLFLDLAQNLVDAADDQILKIFDRFGINNLGL